MNKSTQSLLLTSFLFLFALAPNSFAQDIPQAPNFLEFKMVGSNNPQLSTSREERTTFSLSETPFLYIQTSSPLSASLKTYWTGPDLKVKTRSKSITQASGTEFWLNLLYWNKDKQPGQWNVNGQLWTDNSLSYKTATHFVITPEPTACLLYGMGGLPLLGRLFRRKTNSTSIA